ncbi:MAG: hypothetical protein KJ893_05555 [Candidatus Omnitrophica bacterium]|nr:hypothetical protein [Candidatus Omnitrophota bacterium]MBU4477742.1 hypothetical protein [Candidatus Omnitrophota bacterium]MCG2703034.1 hypothetical protein [Candidatus Omnitrophota bacterium]
MRKKRLCAFAVFVGMLLPVSTAQAEPVVVNDIDINAQDTTTRITITSSQQLQIETFKNDESPANYIILDFLGTVYANLPAIREAANGPVDKISFVHGEEKPMENFGEGYYSLDFLAVNLKTVADFQVQQNGNVVVLTVTAEVPAATKKAPAEVIFVPTPEPEQAVDLTPPIVVSRTPEPEQKPEVKKAGTAPVASSAAKQSEIKAVSAKEDERPKKKEKKKKKGILGRLFTKKKHKEEAEILPVEEKQKKEEMPVQTKRHKVSPPVKIETAAPSSSFLIDRIVNETIKDKESTGLRIEQLTGELKKLQEELFLSKDERSKVESKISEILSKLDELKNNVDEEIRRRQMLGEKVEDLIAKREAYMKAKQTYEELGARLTDVSARADSLSSEMQNIKMKLDITQSEKRKMEDEMRALSADYANVQSEYDEAVKQRDNVSLQIDRLAVQLNQLRLDLDKATAEKSKLVAQIKTLENKNKYSNVEISRLKQIVQEKNTMVVSFSQQFDQLKKDYDSVTAEKVKIEYSYQNAKAEFERIKRQIEDLLEKKN